jgi:hypothetical protein
VYRLIRKRYDRLFIIKHSPGHGRRFTLSVKFLGLDSILLFEPH